MKGEAKTASGALLPDSVKHEIIAWRVFAVCPIKRDTAGSLTTMATKAGDAIMIPRYDGTAVQMGKLKNEDYHVYRDNDIVCLFKRE